MQNVTRFVDPGDLALELFRLKVGRRIVPTATNNSGDLRGRRDQTTGVRGGGFRPRSARYRAPHSPSATTPSRH